MSGPAARPIISVIGDLAADYYLILPRRQEGDEKRAATRSLRLPGGTGGNAAVTAAVLGSQVTLYSVVGTDQLGAWLMAGVAARGGEHERSASGTRRHHAGHDPAGTRRPPVQ
jgi:sugar/nucleoside kinase (ribokinase family)